MRAEHNCHLCKKEWLGRCFGKYHGKDVSVDDAPVCDEYEFGGSEEKLEVINKAEALGVTELPDDWKESLEDKKMNKPLAVAVRIYQGGTFPMADIRTSPCDGSKLETITWTNAEERNRFVYNGYTLFYDTRTIKPFLDIR